MRGWRRSASSTPSTLGNSMGCQIVVELGDLATELVRAAVLLGPTMDPTGGVVGQIGRLLMDQFREPLSLVPLQAFDYPGNGPIRTVNSCCITSLVRL